MASKNNLSSKEIILNRIKSGLAKGTLPMPFPEAEGKPTNQVYTYKGLEPEETFAEEFIKLGGKFVYCDNEQDMMRQLTALQDTKGWDAIVCPDDALLELCRENKLNFIKKASLSDEDAPACITYCDKMVARTGSFIFTSKETMGRTAPVFFPTHIVVAYAHQIIDDITPALESVIENNAPMPSMINLNTGPSRTADIEKTLVVGVHGPGEVYCFFINK